jgi:hypothetical protein
MEEQSADSPQLDRAERIEVKTSDGRNYTLPAERKDRPAKTTNELTGIITQLTEIDTNKAAKKELSAAVKHIETAKTLINKDLSQ